MTKVKGNHKDYALVVDSGGLHRDPQCKYPPHGLTYTGISPLQRDFSSLVLFTGRRSRQGRAAVDGIGMASWGTGSQPLEHVAEYTYPHRRDVRRCKVPCFACVRHQGVLQKAQAELGALVEKKKKSGLIRWDSSALQ